MRVLWLLRSSTFVAGKPLFNRARWACWCFTSRYFMQLPEVPSIVAQPTMTTTTTTRTTTTKALQHGGPARTSGRHSLVTTSAFAPVKAQVSERHQHNEATFSFDLHTHDHDAAIRQQFRLLRLWSRGPVGLALPMHTGPRPHHRACSEVGAHGEKCLPSPGRTLTKQAADPSDRSGSTLWVFILAGN